MTATLIPSGIIAGPFNLTYKAPGASVASSLGLVGPDGIRISRSVGGEPITSDQYGPETILDAIYTGGNYYLEFLLREASFTACKSLAYPFNETNTTNFGKNTLERELGTPGVLYSASCGEMVATAIAGTAAAGETTPTRTYSKVILAPGHNIDFFIKTGQKNFPIRLLCLPYTDSVSGKVVWFTQS